MLFGMNLQRLALETLLALTLAAVGCGTDSPARSDAAVDASLYSVCPPPSGPEPSYGSPCMGDLHCYLHRHIDCSAPRCPAGCKFVGVKPNARQFTGGIAFFSDCRDGRWVETRAGYCHADSDAICECSDQDAGS